MTPRMPSGDVSPVVAVAVGGTTGSVVIVEPLGIDAGAEAPSSQHPWNAVAVAVAQYAT
jgi:hypothetical protein